MPSPNSKIRLKRLDSLHVPSVETADPLQDTPEIERSPSTAKGGLPSESPQPIDLESEEGQALQGPARQRRQPARPRSQRSQYSEEPTSVWPSEGREGRDISQSQPRRSARRQSAEKRGSQEEDLQPRGGKLESKGTNAIKVSPCLAKLLNLRKLSLPR